MSFALPTITLLYLLAPGLIFRRFYFTGEFSAEYFKPAFSDLLFSTILPSLPIHILGYCCVMKWYILDANTLAVLLSGTDDSVAIEKALSNLYTLFVIPFEHIKNIHITYYSVHADKELQSQMDAAVLPP